MASTALAAAAAGTPTQARAMLAKIRARAMEAAADGADTAELESLARELERLAKIAERNEQREKHGGADHSAAAIPALTAIASA